MKAKNGISREDFIHKIEIGAPIHVNDESGELKYRANVVGYINGTLITSLPSPKQLKADAVAYPERFPKDKDLVMRLIAKGTIYAFQTSVKGLDLNLCKTLLSALPEKIQTRKLRKGVRYPCVLQANLLVGETKYRGVLTNISEGGCLLSMKTGANIQAIQSLMENKKTTRLDIRFPFEDKDSTFEANIKSMSEGATGNYSLGISYTEEPGVADVVRKYFEFMQLEELSEYLVLT